MVKVEKSICLQVINVQVYLCMVYVKYCVHNVQTPHNAIHIIFVLFLCFCFMSFDLFIGSTALCMEFCQINWFIFILVYCLTEKRIHLVHFHSWVGMVFCGVLLCQFIQKILYFDDDQFLIVNKNIWFFFLFYFYDLLV